MIGVLLVTHGALAEEMAATLAIVLGPLEQVEAVSTGVEDDPDVLRRKIEHAIQRLDSGDGTLILTDMLGDTATNLSLVISRDLQAEVVAGVNMPMLLKAVTSREGKELRELAAFIQDYGRTHILWASRSEALVGSRRG
jgi:PTS system mannose-specific IIA component